MLLHPGFDEGSVDMLPVVVELLVRDVWTFLEECYAAIGLFCLTVVGHGVDVSCKGLSVSEDCGNVFTVLFFSERGLYSFFIFIDRDSRIAQRFEVVRITDPENRNR